MCFPLFLELPSLKPPFKHLNETEERNHPNMNIFTIWELPVVPRKAEAEVSKIGTL
jgi:hypothetical protein